MAKNKFPIIPLVVSAAAAGLDGVVASSDVNAGRTSITKQRTLWVQGGLVATGLVGEFMNWPVDIVDPLMFSGVTLFTRELAFKMAQGGRATPAAPQGLIRAYVPQPAAALARPAAHAAVAAGYAYNQQPGSVA